MEKRIYGETLKERLVANARDRMQLFLLSDGTVRGALLEGTKLVNEMRANHELGILESLILGHAYIGALLMSSNLKGQDRIAIQITCDGPVKGLSVEANAFGEVRGFLNELSIAIDSPLESFDISPFFGSGVLSVTKILENARRPFTGQITLDRGSIAENLANFSARSEQIPTAYNLSIKFDSDGVIVGAGGLMIQALPGADARTLAEIENAVRQLPSLGVSFGEGREVDQFLLEELAEFSPEALASRLVEFMCHCKAERFERFLGKLSIKELKDMAETGPFPLVLTCYNCNTHYSFEKAKVESIYSDALGRQHD